MKGGLFLEQLGKVDTVVLDKTGTLTYGQPQLRAVLPAAGTDGAVLLDAAASAEVRSEHPLGKTIVAYARAQGRSLREPERFGYTPGRGIDATVGGELVLVGNLALMRDRGIDIASDLLADHPGASEVYVARAGTLLGAIVIADRVRPEAHRAIATIHGMGIKTVLLTGDAKTVAAVVARELGIAEIAAELLPEDKRERVKRLVAEGRTVAMVGDGVNDAPALVEAQVGVAMGSGTHVARESADVVLLGNDLVKFAETLAIARRTRRIIWANFAGTLGVDGVGIAPCCIRPAQSAACGLHPRHFGIDLHSQFGTTASRAHERHGKRKTGIVVGGNRQNRPLSAAPRGATASTYHSPRECY